MKIAVVLNNAHRILRRMQCQNFMRACTCAFLMEMCIYLTQEIQYFTIFKRKCDSYFRLHFIRINMVSNQLLHSRKLSRENSFHENVTTSTFADSYYRPDMGYECIIIAYTCSRRQLLRKGPVPRNSRRFSQFPAIQ